MKVEWLQSAAEPIIEGQRKRDQRAVGSVRGENAESCRIGEEQFRVVQAADIGVVVDGVKVVEVKPVLEVIGVGERHGRQHQQCGKGQRLSLRSSLNLLRHETNLAYRTIL